MTGELKTGGCYMKMHMIKRVLVTASVVTAAGVVPLVTATSASADQSRCVNYIGDHGYLVGPKVKGACSHAAWHAGSVVANPACLSGLVNIHVELSDAQAACLRA
ncbi:hypothetical protein ACIOHS_10420 [Streptomyces sp. NPDC088253]|uniref:hypothetical protein n=1 Tax=Streptomyces sp. NPDC088253 TaxID=3365846 RepID=UPI003828FCFC